MAAFIALLDFTDQGIRNIADSTLRADKFREMYWSAPDPVHPELASTPVTHRTCL